MTVDEIVKEIKEDPEFERLIRVFATAPAARREKRKQEVMDYLAEKMSRDLRR